VNLLFRADASRTLGLGHIMRDLVLAERYRSLGVRVYFATQPLEGNGNTFIVDSGYEVLSLASMEQSLLVQMISEYAIDHLVIDHYEINAWDETQLKNETGVFITVIDDHYRPHVCDQLINPNRSANEQRYHGLVPEFCELLCGAEHVLLRQSFYEAKHQNIPKAPSIIVMMGGVDSENLSLPIVTCLEAYSGIEVDLITTTSNPHLIELKHYASTHPRITLHINTNQVAPLMAKSRGAIITPSGVLNEVMFMELPFIAIQTAENQHLNVEYLEANALHILREFKIEAFQTMLREFMACLEH